MIIYILRGTTLHLSLMPGDSHNSNSQSKGVAGLMQCEVNVLTLTLKAKTMCIVKVTKAIGASKEPIIIGEAPPADSPFPNTRPCTPSTQLCHNQEEEVEGPLISYTDIAAMDSMTAICHKTKMCPEVLIPPLCPFKLVKCPPAKPVVIEVRSSPDVVDELHDDDDDDDDDDDEEEEEEEEPLNGSCREIPSEGDKDYDDFSHSQKRKLKAGGDNAAKRICDGPPDVQKVPHAHPMPKGRQPVLTKASRKHLLFQQFHPAHDSDHPAELAPDDGQSVLVPDTPLPLPQNLLHSLLEDTHLSPSLSGHNVLESHHADPRRADTTHSCEPHDNWHPHNCGQSWEARNANDVHNLPLNDGRDLHPRRDNSPALHDDRRHPNDDPHSNHNQEETTLITGSIHIAATGAQAIMMPPDHELLDDHLCGPPLLDIRGEYMHPASHEGHAGYQCAYQCQPPRGDGHQSTWSLIANMPLTLPGQVTEQEQREGAAIQSKKNINTSIYYQGALRGAEEGGGGPWEREESSAKGALYKRCIAECEKALRQMCDMM
ncbi:hypothetical protein DEU56DRAFT_758152 [Suillus clintonianus]|uniref:uncharacterized protein n=1 Tax=Suillus clintonianus TaxID=1904413 RepID=UPI001B862C23|nr:uncharacterized protein DEU56DRAFT_758152 [Suillus clintonianus]KAG2129454.1 hypothetical protein DEU56DRAFT_758152 [Suillus clintonianus]